MTSDTILAKHAARARARETLARIDPAERSARSRDVCRRLIEWDPFAAATGLMVYLPLPGSPEPDLSEVIRQARDRGAWLAAPRVDWASGTMNAAPLRFDPAGNPITEVRRLGVPEPALAPAPALTTSVPGLILVPGLAFDPRGGRLGRGGGFYDRFLAGMRCSAGHRPVCVGVAFEPQLVSIVPIAAHDFPMDAVVTDQRLIIP